MNENRTKTILIADDSPSILTLLGAVCKKAGYDVVKATNGRDALKIAFEKNFAAIVADHEMPELSGKDLFKILKADPEKNRIPRIMISGHSADGEGPASMFADVYIHKNTDLKQAVLAALDSLT